jgi:histidinol-phosphatase (PHP family)
VSKKNTKPASKAAVKAKTAPGKSSVKPKPGAGRKQGGAPVKTMAKPAVQKAAKTAAPVTKTAKAIQKKTAKATQKKTAKPAKAVKTKDAKAAKQPPAPRKVAKAGKAKPTAKTASKPEAKKSAKQPAAKSAPEKKAKPEKKPAPMLNESVAIEEKPAGKSEVVATAVQVGTPASDHVPGPVASGALYYDSHMHTPLCKHAWGEPEEYAAQGLQAGLKGIIFTCHCPMPDGFWPAVRMADSEFDTYIALVRRAAEAYAGRLDVRLGLESEFFPGVEPWIEKLHQRADFDYILGAVHWQARDYLTRYETGTIEAFRRTYFNHLAESAETGLYDCLAHPDLVKNYHPDSWCLAIVKDVIGAALDRIAATGVAMELNTSGLIKSYSEMNPGLEMLRMMADREIPVVIGSDAHRPHRVGEHFMTALSHLQEAGYDSVSYFMGRKRIDLKIAAVQASIKKAADSQIS